LRGAPCLHFDFGANLREVVQHNQPDTILSPADIDFLRGVLTSGALLEDGEFPIARRILQSFLARHAAARQTVVVLNGLPRHAGQARALESLLDVRDVLYLVCAGETVFQRIQTNVGGDRTQRIDDSLEAVRHKLEIFHQRTTPLVDYYRAQGAVVREVEVRANTTAEDIWRAVAEHAIPKGVT
jgi:adenylate kinase family enzyme